MADEETVDAPASRTNERASASASPRFSRALTSPRPPFPRPPPLAVTSPVAAIQDSPGDQANFEDTSPNLAPATSPKSPSWREMAEERPKSPARDAADPRTMTPPSSPGPHAGTNPGGVIASPEPGSPGGNRSAYDYPASPGAAPPRSAFSTALSNISAAVDNLWEKAKKRQAKQQRRAQGGKLLLQQLQDEAGAKDPSLLPGVMRAPAGDPRYAPPTMAAAVKNAIWGQPPPADPTTGLVPVGDAVAVKQGYMYKLKAAKRRAKQAMLVSTSKTRKVPDEDFDALWARVQRQEALLNKIKADGKRYAKAMKELSAAAQSISGHIVELAEGGEKEAELGGSSEQPPPAERPAGTGASREQVVARARQLAEVMGTIDADVRPACEGQLWSSVTQPVGQLCEEFPAYQPCVDKRRNYMLDMDAYERKLRDARLHSRDPGQVPHREEQFSRAQRRFTYFSDKLVEDLTLLDANRFELAGFLLEGFVETQEFALQRHRDVMAALSVGKLPQRTA